MEKCGILIMISSLILVVLPRMRCASIPSVSRPGNPNKAQCRVRCRYPLTTHRIFPIKSCISVHSCPDFDGGVNAVNVTVQVRNFSLVNGIGCKKPNFNSIYINNTDNFYPSF